MTKRKTILLNATLAAAVLAAVGYLYAQAIVLLTSSQPVVRAGAVITPELAEQPAGPIAAVGVMVWRLPLVMAFLGFAFVVIGEGIAGLWQQQQKAGTVNLDVPTAAQTEAETQEALRAIEAQETIRMARESSGMLLGVEEEEADSVFQTH